MLHEALNLNISGIVDAYYRLGECRMFYRMIEKKREQWFSSEACTVKELVKYIEDTAVMRDAQINAIKTWLFLKISCQNKPLWELYSQGYFNSINTDDLEVKTSVKEVLKNKPEALALYEYATLRNDKGEQVSEKLEDEIKTNPEKIDYIKVFKDAFYGVSYTDYIFSLPMGAGKTYLMAAFIYLELYFSVNEPDNNIFAHNFIIFAPSGLKSSVVPSLRTIQKFNPTWIIPEPAASDVKRLIKFEVLDQSKTANKSSKIKNPNVQKIAIHQPINELIGLVAVTNAEKVILDRIVIKDGQISMFDQSDDEKDQQANELRNLIGKLPNLAIFIDEVHHASNEEIKLRAVVNNWLEKNSTINSVIGFSGTPYLEKAHTIGVTEKLSIKNIEISNTVYYYPLIKGIDNFLKRPTVKISNESESLQIIESGVRNFFDLYQDKVYGDGCIAKLGIYCGKGSYKSAIDYLEEVVYPCVAKIVEEYGINPSETILRFHQGNKNHPVPTESKYQFESLDKPFSKIRIVLLVQIGKEGWDCRSLTGVILSQKGDCPTNMVLQTSCRCLRQVERGKHESALIWLNEFNADKLNLQLQQQHNISLTEFRNGAKSDTSEIKRYNRMKYLHLPKMDFYQMKISYNTIVMKEEMNTYKDIELAVSDDSKHDILIKTQDFEQKIIDRTIEEARTLEIADFSRWLYNISKESFGFITMSMLNKYKEILNKVYIKITIENNGYRYFNSQYNLKIIDSNIRKAFSENRTLQTVEEIIPQEANLLKVENLLSPVITTKSQSYYPSQDEVEKILLADKGKLKLDTKTQQLIQLAEETGNDKFANEIKVKYQAFPEKDRSFHYLPYKTDSDFEQKFLKEVITLSAVKENDLEVYYNGDNALTEFKIRCYKGKTGKWKYIGMYTPDFLIIKRQEGKIHKAIIVETKGSLYAKDGSFQDKRAFVESEFVNYNNTQFGYKKFDYLYLEDNLSEEKRISQTIETIKRFF